MNLEQFTREINYFLEFVDRVHGLYLDASLGFENNYRFTIEWQNRAINRLAQQDKNITIEDLDQEQMEYMRNSSQGTSHLQHTTSIGSFKARNGGTGSNASFFATLCVSTIYNYWQDHYRQRIADTLGIKKDDVAVSIMADLKYYRRAIVHCKGIATKDIEKCTEIPWFKEGDYITLDSTQMDEVIQKVNHGLRLYQSQIIESYK